MSYNHLTVIGRLGKDPEVRDTQSGTKIAKFSLAVDRGRKGRDGEKETDWFNVAVFGRSVEFVEQYVHKGDLVLVAGRCQIDKYTDRDGGKQTSVEINCNEVQKLSRDDDGERGQGGRDRDSGGDRERGRERDDRGGDRDRGRDDDRGGRSDGGSRDRGDDRGGRTSNRRDEPADDDDDDPFRN